MTRWGRFAPRVPRWGLLAAAGLVWSAVGLMLLRWPWSWLSGLGLTRAALPLVAGAILLGIATAGFRWLAQRNVSRIDSLPGRTCLFGFQRWSGYPLVLFMIALGLTLRHSSIQRVMLAPIYIAIGGGLLLASLVYLRRVIDSAGVQVFARRKGIVSAGAKDGAGWEAK